MSESLRKAMLILDMLRDSTEDVSARELAARLDVPKSTVQRLLQSLEEFQMAVQDTRSRKYHLGPRTLSLGIAYRRRLDLRNTALPHMRALRDEVGETVGLSIAVGSERMFIEEIASQAELRVHSELGFPYPLWMGAPGRVLLAEREPAEREQALAGAAASTTRTHAPTAAELHQQLDAVRAAGYARAFDETLAAVSALAAPVRDASGQVVAALSVSAPSARMDTATMESVLPRLRSTAADIGRALGC